MDLGDLNATQAPRSYFCYIHLASGQSFPGDSVVKNMHAVQETWVRSLDREDSLEKGMITHSSILAWEIPWTEKPGSLQATVLQKSQRQLSD